MKLAVRAASFHLRNLRTRLPFCYGVVTLTRFPLLHMALEVETLSGRRLHGYGADNHGHHHVRGLAHCSDAERGQAVHLHADLYRGDEREASVQIEDGRLRVGSLAVPGYGVAFDPDLASMTPLGRWRFDPLEDGP